MSAPTGPGKFAGLNSFASITHTTTFQPFLGYIINSGRLYFHGFTRDRRPGQFPGRDLDLQRRRESAITCSGPILIPTSTA